MVRRVDQNPGIEPKSAAGLETSRDRLGKLTRAAAAHLGLEAGTPVAVGGPDTQCGLLGMGAVEEGQIGVVAGTTTPVQMVLPKPVVDPEMRTWTGLHVLPGVYVLESNAGQTGSTLDWSLPRCTRFLPFRCPPGRGCGWLSARRQRHALHDWGSGLQRFRPGTACG